MTSLESFLIRPLVLVIFSALTFPEVVLLLLLQFKDQQRELVLQLQLTLQIGLQLLVLGLSIYPFLVDGPIWLFALLIIFQFLALEAFFAREVFDLDIYVQTKRIYSLATKKRMVLFAVFATFGLLGCGLYCSGWLCSFIGLTLAGFLVLEMGIGGTWIQLAFLYYEAYVNHQCLSSSARRPHKQWRWKVYLISSVFAAIVSVAGFAMGLASFSPHVHLPLLALNQMGYSIFNVIWMFMTTFPLIARKFRRRNAPGPTIPLSGDSEANFNLDNSIAPLPLPTTPEHSYLDGNGIEGLGVHPIGGEPIIRSATYSLTVGGQSVDPRLGGDWGNLGYRETEITVSSET